MRRFLLLSLAAAGCGTAPAPQPAAKPEASEVRILQFYSAPGMIGKGDTTNLCYGTENATAVRIEPPVEKLAPALSRCIAVSPQVTTTYKLIVSGADGASHEKTAEVVVSGLAAPKTEAPAVGDPALPKVLSFTAKQNDVAAGTRVELCYATQNTKEIKLFPGVATPEPPKGCFTVTANETRDYTLVAVGMGNIIDRKGLTLRVK